MARNVYFSFDYQRDIWRANIVRNTGAVEAFSLSPAAFLDAASWEEINRRGTGAIQELISDALSRTAVTVVLIGAETANRAWVSYEVEQSRQQGSAILGIRIHNLRDQYGMTDSPGSVPPALVAIGAPVHTWEYGKLGEWIEAAFKQSGQEKP